MFYPTVRQLKIVFAPDFELLDWSGVGIAVPPSYVTGLSSRLVTRLARFDRRIEHLLSVAGFFRPPAVDLPPVPSLTIQDQRPRPVPLAARRRHR